MNTDFDIEVSANGSTVWVTGSDGSCIGRFSKSFGIDCHTTVTEQLAGAGQCLHCTHEPAGPKDWQLFRDLMRIHYGIPVPEDLVRYE